MAHAALGARHNQAAAGEPLGEGRRRAEALRAAIALGDAPLDEAALLARLERQESAPRMSASAWALADEDSAPTADDAFEAVAECCAGYFDHHQQRWERDTTTPLYAWWHDQSRHDRRLSAAQRRRVAALPADADAARERLVDELALPPEALEALAHALLLRVNGWASWCQGLAWHTPPRRRPRRHRPAAGGAAGLGVAGAGRAGPRGVPAGRRSGGRRRQPPGATPTAAPWRR
ncbi:putative inorganic carbon transporter subunit DabA [Halomonas daqiaonensis]|uniref:putative inorganic carbon transporter subunit DabA n=1 Tax=Halomonas daqiaonensis TaxID=650850 RepID=UPI001B8CCDF0|nr:putative inorganic carbon transporter subunit DabA [Halomonas daqiaonensis]